MRKVIIGIVIFVLVLLLTAFIAPSLIPSSVYKDKIQTTLTNELGRDVNIDGDIQLSVFPLIKARAGRVTIANAPDFDDEYFAAMDGLDARIKLWPLFSKRVEIASFTLIAPEIHLQKKASGAVNWVFDAPKNAQEEETQDKSEDSAPFKRDGRYATLDPKIGHFNLQNGHISFDDVAANQHHELRQANLAFSLPSLAQPVSVKGDVIIDGDPFDLSLKLNTPRSFLNGANTPASFNIKTGYATIKGDGHFTASPDINFSFNLSGNVSDLSKLKAYIPEDYPVDQIVNTVNIDGLFSYDGKVFSAENANITALGPLVDASYKGSAHIAEKPILDGHITLKLPDAPKVAKLFKQDIKGLDLVKSLDLTANMKAENKGFSAQTINAKILGEGLSVAITGQGTFADSPSFNGHVVADVTQPAAKAARLGQTIKGLDQLGKVSINGNLDVNGETYKVSNMVADISGDNLALTYNGDGGFANKTASATGQFEGNIYSIPAFVNALALDVPQAGALGAVNVKGEVSLQGETIKVELTEARTDGQNLTADYHGQINIQGKVINLAGDFNANIPSLSTLASAAKTEIPYSSSIGAISAKGRLDGAVDNLKLSGLTAQLSDGELNGKFDGSATLSKNFDLQGRLETRIPNLRNLAASTGLQLPPNPKNGNIFQEAGLSGQVSGNPAQILFSDAKLNFDDISGMGDVRINMSGAKPQMTGTLNLSELDLRPYLDSYSSVNTSEGVQPWSTEPYNFQVLKSIDGEFKITTPKIQLTNMQIGQSDLTATLKNGRLNAVLPQINMYGGLGKMTALVDASNIVPSVAMNLSLDDLSTNKFLSALSGFGRLTGTGLTLLDVKGKGRSQAEIMKSLNGLGNFEVKNGVISGIDISQFMTGLDQALTSRSLPGGLGPSYSTKFKDIISKFTIQNGVVKIDNFDMSALGAAASGGGQVDLGKQTVDFSFRPHATGASAGDLAKFGIPLRLKGSFGNISAGLDTDMLTKIAADRAKAALVDQISNNVGGSAGDVIAGVITGGSSGDTSSDGGSTQGVLGGVVDGIFGGESSSEAINNDNTQGSNTTSETQAEDPQSLEDQVEDAAKDAIGDTLSGLFGGKKKKN